MAASGVRATRPTSRIQPVGHQWVHCLYRDRLALLIRAARPAFRRADCARRAADIDVLQNGLWLTALLGLDRVSIRRCLTRCEQIALAD
jgi:hypothetical protein